MTRTQTLYGKMKPGENSMAYDPEHRSEERNCMESNLTTRWVIV